MQRPKSNETEEDLLKQQAEFLKTAGKDVEPVEPTPRSFDKPAPQKFGIIGDIIERSERETIPNVSCHQSEGFPAIFQVDSKLSAPKKAKKKSLFALKLEEKNRTEPENEHVEKMEVDLGSKLFDVQIHEENVQKLNSMTAAEILEEQKLLESTLSPELLGFLKTRGAKNVSAPLPQASAPQEVKMELADVTEIQENVSKIVDHEWMEMDVIEPEKLRWIGDIPDATALEPGQAYSARFDFAGDLQPFRTDIDVRTSLHHHGDEPERPGYTIQELYQLSRSTVLQQRILALNTLANVIRKTKMGYYDSCFDGALLKKLVESDVFFLLRFAMDDRAATPAAVNCLHELFVSNSDEVCLDRLRNLAMNEKEPFLFVAVEVDQDSTEDELKDHQVIAQDLVRGVLRTDLLVRIGYILTTFELDSITVSKLFEVVIRVCRHSPESCRKVFDSTHFLSYIFSNLNSSLPSHEAVKLIRVMASSSRSLAQSLTSRFSFDFMLTAIDQDAPLFKLKLECLALWKTLLSNGLKTDSVHSFTPCLVRLLWFYVAKVNISHGRFDFELFAGIVSVLNAALDLKLTLDPSYDTVLQVCLKKWLTQIVPSGNINFSVAKAVGCAMNFFILKYRHDGFTQTDLKFVEELKQIISVFLGSECFGNICSALETFSHILHSGSVDRDPENLPSLCSIYHNGADYLKIVQDGSPLPLIQPLAELLLVLSGLSQDFEKYLHLLSQRLDVFAQKILSAPESSSWFCRPEVGTLISLLKVKLKCSDPKALDFSFKLVSHLRTDDQRVLTIINVISQLSISSDACEIYKTHMMRNLTENLFHSCENFSRHWMFEPIAAAPQQTLNCLSNILEHCPDLISRVPPTLRFCHLCLVLLDGENVFNPEIHANLERCMQDVVANFDKLDLNSVTVSEKTFYELFRDLVNEYASSSYGDLLFAKVVTLPLAQKFDVSFRKLIWSEFMHALRVITLPKDVPDFVSLDIFTSPVETDESLLVLYLNAISKGFLTDTRNGFIYEVAAENVRNFLALTVKDENVASFLRRKIGEMGNENLKNRLLS